MGNWMISIRGAGPHHNDQSGDVEVLATDLVARLRSHRHEIRSAHVTIGGEIDLHARLESVHQADYAVNLGKEAYERYCTHTGWKSLATGARLPPWTELKPEIREAWMVTAAWIVGRTMRLNGLTESQLTPLLSHPQAESGGAG